MDTKVTMDIEENMYTHFHRGIVILKNDATDIVNSVNIYYSAHSSPPCFHSYARPPASIIMNTEENIKTLLERLEAGILGNRRAISRSNIRNNIAIRKNRKENGRRADFIGSNPHSYGDFFSSFNVRVGKRCPIISKKLDSAMVSNIKIVRFMVLINIKEKWQIVYAANLKLVDGG